MPGAKAVVKIVAIGDELLEGRTADTNSRRIQQALGSHAVSVGLIQVVPDREVDIAAALDRTGAGDLVFVTGGLGSTPDDLTRDAVARWAGVKLVPDAQVLARLEERWQKRGLKNSPGVVRQAEVPVGLTALDNPVGSAPGLVGRLRDRTLVLLPGVPQELQGLLEPVVRWLEENDVLPQRRATRLWRTAQVAELALVKKCVPLTRAYPHLEWSWWLSDWGVDIRVKATAPSDATDLEEAGLRVEETLGHLIYARGMKTLPEVVQDLMLERRATLAVAESCTAGMIGGALTDPAGASGYFRGGMMVYADQIKIEQLGVPAEVLATDGAVSRRTVTAMASGCRQRIGTDYALAVSGISGPGGGTDEKPVGTTWIALATGDRVLAHKYRFPADRQRNRLLTVAAAVDSLRRVLVFGEDESPWRPDDSWCRPS